MFPTEKNEVKLKEVYASKTLAEQDKQFMQRIL